jgi:hypothetical protein
MAKFVKPKFEDQNKTFMALANKVFADISQQDIRRNLIDQMIEDLKKRYNKAATQELKMPLWKSLEETNSWTAEKMSVIEKTIKRQEIPNFKQIIIQLLEEKAVDTPVIMMQKNVGMLISGENILLACRLLNIQPRVVII